MNTFPKWKEEEKKKLRDTILTKTTNHKLMTVKYDISSFPRLGIFLESKMWYYYTTLAKKQKTKGESFFWKRKKNDSYEIIRLIID